MPRSLTDVVSKDAVLGSLDMLALVFDMHGDFGHVGMGWRCIAWRYSRERERRAVGTLGLVGSTGRGCCSNKWDAMAQLAW